MTKNLEQYRSTCCQSTLSVTIDESEITAICTRCKSIVFWECPIGYIQIDNTVTVNLPHEWITDTFDDQNSLFRRT